jgi:hypothetical protein
MHTPHIAPGDTALSKELSCQRGFHRLGLRQQMGGMARQFPPGLRQHQAPGGAVEQAAASRCSSRVKAFETVDADRPSRRPRR